MILGVWLAVKCRTIVRRPAVPRLVFQTLSTPGAIGEKLLDRENVPGRQGFANWSGVFARVVSGILRLAKTHVVMLLRTSDYGETQPLV